MSEVKVPDGYKQTEIGVIPEDWGSIKVQDVCDFIVPGRNKPQKFDGDIPWITTPDLIDGRAVFFSRSGLKISKEVAKTVGSKIVPAGSVIMSCVGELGLVAIAGVNIVINQQLHAFLPSKKIDNYFLMYALKDQENYFHGAATKTALPYLNKDNCNATPLPLPSIQEQTAIATALSDVDNLIGSLEKLIAKKEAIKTGTMQQLLTGKTRLPEFATRDDGSPKGFKQTELGRIPEDWEAVEFGEIVNSTQLGGNYANSIKPTDFPLIKMGNIDRGQIKLDKQEYITGSAQNKDLLKYSDLLFNTRNTLELVGKVAIWRNELPVAYFNSNLMRISFLESLISNNFFINYLMNSKYFIGQLSEIAIGTTSVAAIYSKDLFKIKLSLPYRQEQTAIATTLSDMDSEIQALQQRLEKTKDIKQGMMQQLLTGKVRLV